MEAGTVTPTQQAAPPPRLRDKYESDVLPALNPAAPVPSRVPGGDGPRP